MKIYTADFGQYDKEWEGPDIRYNEYNDPLDTEGLSPKMRAKQYKMTALLPEAIWIDSNIEVLDRKRFERTMKLDGHDMVFLPHPARYEIAGEFRVVRQSGLDDPRAIDRATRLYRDNPDYRTLCGGVFAYQNTKAVTRFFDLWWALVRATSQRDQLSLPFALSVSQVKYRVVEIDLWDNELFKVRSHGV